MCSGEHRKSRERTWNSRDDTLAWTRIHDELEEGCALLQDKQASTWGLLIDRDLMMMISVSREGEEDQKGKETDVEGRSVVSEKTDSFH